MSLRPWIERDFELGVRAEAFPGVVERLRGTPARIEERVRVLSSEALTRRQDGRWSIQENVGHLLDLEPLGALRLDELRSGAKVLQPADMGNRETDEARHNDRPVETILARFRAERETFVAELESLAPADLGLAALHPRLQQPMTVTDLAFFIAEHDDHHLARISEIARRLTAPATPEGSTTPTLDYGRLLAVAVEEARTGLREGGVPIGAALCDRSGRVLGRGHNRRVQEDDPSVHGETDAFRKAGRQRTYRDKIMVTTLAPCWYCSGLIRQFKIGTVVVGESVNFSGGIEWLRQGGVEVVDLESSECIEMLAGYIEEHPEIWDEDIGEGEEPGS